MERYHHIKRYQSKALSLIYIRRNTRITSHNANMTANQKQQ